MEEPSVRCETFLLSADAVPSLNDMLRATDPAQLEHVYREAGLQALAANVGPLRRASAAAQCYAELSAGDYRLYADFLSQAVKLKGCVIPPPESALTILVAAQKANLFDDIVVLTDPATNESLLLGYVKVGNETRYFKIAHWGYGLTSIEQLRKL